MTIRRTLLAGDYFLHVEHGLVDRAMKVFAPHEYVSPEGNRISDPVVVTGTGNALLFDEPELFLVLSSAEIEAVEDLIRAIRRDVEFAVMKLAAGGTPPDVGTKLIASALLAQAIALGAQPPAKG